MDRRPSLDPNGQAPNPLRTHISRRPSHSPSSPLSSAPPTPTAPTPRRPPHPATSPLPPPATNSPKTVRRASSSMSMSARSTPPPKLAHRTSRQSLGEDATNGSEKRPTPKRSISNLIASLREASQGTMERIEEPVPLTAEGIAAEHFARELDAHAREDVESETVVLLHDACYGHKWSRPKTTKTGLSMIVERPERISACVLGASVAFVRMSGQHAGARDAPVPGRREGSARPPFRLRRTGRSMDVTSPYVTAVHGTAWMSELRGMCESAPARLAAGEREIQRSDPAARTLHPGDLYLCPDSLDAFQGALGGVAEAVDSIFNPPASIRRAFVAVRPPGHHCSSDHPSGFCWLNNVHVGIEYAAQVHGLTHAVILDFDLHHGDGSQAITWQRNSKNNEKRLSGKPMAKMKLGPDIGYYSLHDINSYPCELGDDEKVQAASLCIEGAHGQNIWNVHLQPWKTEDEFWELYENRYRILLEKARVFLREHAKKHGEKAKAAVFISAGFDASEWEGSGMQRHKVNVPTEFYARFTGECVEMAREPGLRCEGRVVSVLEGGYSDRALCSGVLAHLSGLCGTDINKANGEVEVKKEKEPSPGLDEIMRGLQINHTITASAVTYDKSWWASNSLTALDHHISPPPPLPAGATKRRTGAQPTYATPTESFAYKVVDPNKFARSISGTMRETPIPVRPPAPPAPEVNWIVASVELSKLLTPIERGDAWVRSKTAEELGGVRTKKERQSAMPALSTTGGEEVGKPRQLRERKGKVVGYAASSHSDEVDGGDARGVRSRSVSRASDAGRRQTIANFPLVSDAVVEEKPMARRQSRRLSAGSALSLDAPAEDLAPPPMPVPVPPVRSVLSTTNGAGARAMAPPPAPASRALPSAKDGLGVKKTRAPSKTSNASLPAPPHPLPPPAQAAANPTAHTPPAASTDLDRLTTGMKRISLKLGTREESERKSKEKEAAQRRERALKGAETRRVNAAARKAAAANAGPAIGAGSGKTSAAVPTNAAPSMPTVAASADPAGAEGGALAQSMEMDGSAVAPAPLSGDVQPLAGNSASEYAPAATMTAAKNLAGSTVAAHQQPPIEPVQLPTPEAPVATSYPAGTQEDMNISSSFEHAMLAKGAAGAPAIELQPTFDNFQPMPVAGHNEMPMLPSYPAIRHEMTENNPTGTAATTNAARPALPVWSSTGPIPFAPARTVPVESLLNARPCERSNDEGAIVLDATVAAHPNEPVGSGQHVSHDTRSVWEVPDTSSK